MRYRAVWVVLLFALGMIIPAVLTSSVTSSAAGADQETCTIHWDCQQGEFCYKGRCILDQSGSLVYHCGKPGCPPGQWCMNSDNVKDVCAEDPTYTCTTACDCGPGHCCHDNLCVKDLLDPWKPGGIEIGPSCVQGVDATYCSTDTACWAGDSAYWQQQNPNFRCYNPYTGEIRDFCGGQDCYYAGDCARGDYCADMRSADPYQSTPGQLSSAAGGSCVPGATLEAVFGWSPSDLIPACSWCTGGRTCEAGWRPGDQAVIEFVIGQCGACGDDTCDLTGGETTANCPADCGCGDGVCDTSEVGVCSTDCGWCDASGCQQPVMPVEWNTLSVCGDGVCQHDGTIAEDCKNCSLDCDAVNDSDGDGVKDGCDLCPADPGKTEPGQCGCGVPDTDTDADTVLDCLDNCPATANPTQADFDSDGIGDACDPDVDGDGVLNQKDQCPDTVIPDPSVPTSGSLSVNRWAMLDDDTWFDTRTANGRETTASFSIAQTAGCNAGQIADQLDLADEFYAHGLTAGLIRSWINHVAR